MKKIGALLSVAFSVIMILSLPSMVLGASGLTVGVYNDAHTTATYGNSKVCGDHICGPGEHTQMINNMLVAQRSSKITNETSPTPTTTAPKVVVTPKPVSTIPTITTNKTSSNTMTTQSISPVAESWITKTGTLTSIQDPGQGHESHQLAIVLPPSDKIYTGVVSWTSSQPMQVVQLTGPIGVNDSKGQTTWSTDGKTKFAVTLVNINSTTGSFAFTGNALAFHLPQPTPFTVSYSVSYMESQSSNTVKTGTLTSIQDPGQGHESHQLALILPPSDRPYHGVLSYSASEPVQLVSLIGPIDPADKKGQLIYTMEGKTWYALVFVDSGQSMGTWQFTGNALALHTKSTTPFQVDYTVDAHN